ncbi:AbgT family transporter [Moraxella nonliquefaciens]|uniref:AbgT family antimetabolite efflux transporter n=1 Tax=Moraxella nonliquefaciens TaxID=478 RepID=A0A1B8QKL6_MORNO|nr:AbgT family antimetabolite efflux transporter [Moraxella nonliquefaciens]OBX84071.1 aminobenzoyl-glutamate transporter [Moraxella nonliquefaciens]QPT44756.1 AbgT family antimetabolite efflux transporter [Moraxella nonliquefaciens]QQC29776.1 AbgT family antimetabolite efflux transporter [Moraxella nonliquefaciens]
MQEKATSSQMQRFLRGVEWLGNLLPHPAILFVWMSVILLVASAILSMMGVSVVDPRPEGAKGRGEDGMIYVVNLLNGDGIAKIVENLVSNFTGFIPLGTVLVALLGVGIAERSGMISAALRGLVMNAPPKMVTFVVVFTGIMSNTASELGYVVLIPLAAMIFHSLGRHPLAGLAAAFAGVSGGYSANLLLGTVDPLLSGISQEAARIIDPEYVVGAEANWYFMAVSTFLVSGIGYFVTEKIVEPSLGKYNPDDADDPSVLDTKAERLTALEKKGLLWSGVSMLIFCLLLAWTIVPADGILRHPTTGLVAGSPFLHGIVVFIFVFFAIPGIVYGKITNTIKTNDDVVNAMSAAMSSLSMYIVLVFFAAQFTAFFNWSNIGSVMAVSGANLLNDIGLTGPLLLVGFILICAFVNLMLGSASAQWAITAPIFVPMLMLTGYAPEMIQAAYRIGDSSTNIITPMMSYFGLIMAVAIRYKKDTGVGTLMSLMIPYSLLFLVGWTVLFCIWVFALGLPVGPGAATYYTP